MVRYKSLFNFTVILAITAMYLVIPSTADDDTCMWCDSKKLKVFLDCIFNKIRNNPLLYRLSETSLKDMENSMLAAANAMTESSETMKTGMMNGAMAGELAELIKSQLSQPVLQDPRRVTEELMGIVGTCYGHIYPIINEKLLERLANTVELILKTSDDKSAQYWGNTNTYPNQNYPSNNLPRVVYPINEQNKQTNQVQQQNSLQTFTTFNAANRFQQNSQNFGSYSQNSNINDRVIGRYDSYPQNNQPYNPSNQYDRRNAVAYSGTAYNETQSTNYDYNPYRALSASSSSSSSFSKSDNGNNAAFVPSRSVSSASNGYSKPVTTGTTPESSANSRYDYEGTLNKNPSASESSGSGGSDAKIFYRALYYDLLTCDYFKYIFNGKTSKSDAKSWADKIIRSLSVDYGNKVMTETAQECLRRMATLPKTCNTEMYADYIAKCLTDIFLYYGLISQDIPQAQAKDVAEKMNNFLENIIPKNRQINNYDGDDGYNGQSSVTNSNTKSNYLYDYPYDDYSNEGYPYDDYSNEDYPYDDDYSYDGNTAYNESQSTNNDYSVNPASSASASSSSSFPKSGNGNNAAFVSSSASNRNSKPVTTGTTIDSSANSRYDNDGTLNKKPNASKSSDNDGPAADKRLHREIIFYEALYYDLLTYKDFKYIFNEKTSKLDAKSWADRMIRSLSVDYGNKIMTETAQESLRRMATLPKTCNTEIYAKYIAKCLSDVFLYYGLISQDIPATQAKDIAKKINNFLKNIILKNNQVNNYDGDDNYNGQSSETNSNTNSDNPYEYDNTYDDYPNYGYYNYYNYGDEQSSENGNDGNSDGTQQNVSTESAAASGSSSGDDNQYISNNDYSYDANNERYYNDYEYGNNYDDEKSSRIGNDGNSDGTQQNVNTASAATSSSSNTEQNDPQSSRLQNGYQNLNLIQTTNQASLQTSSNEKNTESNDRIKILMQWALSSMSNGKFDYNLFSSVIAALAKFVQNTNPKWGAQKAQTRILIETIVSLIQLLLKGKDCLADTSNNSKNTAVPDSVVSNFLISSSDQTNTVQNDQSYSAQQQNNYNSNYQTGQENTYSNSEIQDSFAPLQRPANQYSAPQQTYINNQQNNQDYTGAEQNIWNSRYQEDQRYQNTDLPVQNSYPNQQPATLFATSQQTNANMLGRTWDSNREADSFSTSQTGTSGIRNGNLNQNSVPPSNENNWAYLQQNGLNNQNLMQTGYQRKDAIFPPRSQNNVFTQGNQQNW